MSLKLRCHSFDTRSLDEKQENIKKEFAMR